MLQKEFLFVGLEGLDTIIKGLLGFINSNGSISSSLAVFRRRLRGRGGGGRGGGSETIIIQPQTTFNQILKTGKVITNTLN